MNRFRQLLTTKRPLIMGILNVTPDSFSDGGHYLSPEQAVRHALEMVRSGADIIDIGGESTRPGAETVPIATQLERVTPVIRLLRERLAETVAISIDTTQSEVARAALDAGADAINDVSAGMDDPEMLPLAAGRNVPIILMHRRGSSMTMQDNPHYEHALNEVIADLQERVTAALNSGILPANILIDPGIGFGKRKSDNLVLLAGLHRMVAMGYPVLLGTSRKRFMGTICDVQKPAELMAATVATTALGIMAGVHIFRVHDVRENRQAADMTAAIRDAAQNI